MNQIFLYASIFIGFLMLLAMFRAIVGPSILDRLVGANAIGSLTIPLLLLIGLLFHNVEMFIDIALAYALLNFIAVIASAKYFKKKKGLFDES